MLRGVVVILDIRRGLEADDRQLIDFLRACDRPAVIVANKIDKLNRSELVRSLDEIQNHLATRVLPFSAHTGAGRRELWQRLAQTAGLG